MRPIKTYPCNRIFATAKVITIITRRFAENPDFRNSVNFVKITASVIKRPRNTKIDQPVAGQVCYNNTINNNTGDKRKHYIRCLQYVVLVFFD
ncbi:hypothetical protein AGMMS49957_16870 [Synergistales bacterium]|nr:hypothetical protein AGMMS49957_16870 [Synergistales bacterium]